MRITWVASMLAAAATLVACGGHSAPSPAASDCSAALRYQEVTYTEVGYLATAAEGLGEVAGEAVLADCADQGASPAGSTFAESADTVDVWRLPGAMAGQAVGRKTADGVQVFVAERLSGQQRAEVMTRLGLGEPGASRHPLLDRSWARCAGYLDRT